METGSNGGQGTRSTLYGLISVMVVFWAANFIVVKLALRDFAPLMAVGLRLALAALFMIPIFWWEFRRFEDSASLRRDFWGLASMGLLGVALNQALFVIGISRTSVMHSAFIVALSPMVVLLVAVLAKQEVLTARRLAGMMVAVAGVAVLHAAPVVDSGPRPTVSGDLLILASILIFAVFTVSGKALSDRHSPVTLTAFGYIGGAIAMIPVMLRQGAKTSFAAVSLTGWLCVLYMAVFPSVICYLIYYYALKRLSASRLAAFNYLQPVIATVLAVFALGEHITPSLVAGGAVIFSGVFLTERS
jgi:drug/metabolite transporter (DMT)-like permease